MPRTVVVCLLLALLAVIIVSSAPVAGGTGSSAPVGGTLFALWTVQPNRTTYAGPCPVSIVFSVRGNYTTQPAVSTYDYYWMRSDGTKSAVATIKVHPGQQQPIPAADPWNVGAPGLKATVSDTLMIHIGGKHISMPSWKKVRMSCQ